MSVAEIPTKLPSMNEANPRDPYNNNSYGTLVDSPYKLCSLPILDVEDFNERVIRGYEEGYGEKELPADLPIARSLIAAGSATLRDFSYVAPEIPEYIPANCTGCMDCVTECPDTAILGKVLAESTLEERLLTITDPVEREKFANQWSKTRKYFEGPQKKGQEGGRFAIIIDPSKCKGCAECVTVCDDDALKMVTKTDPLMKDIRKSHRLFKQFGPSDERYINENLLIDMMLKEKTHIYVGGAGSCAGCGEGTALRMLCAATGAKYGDQWGIIAATGCNTVYTSTYPYNPYLVPWTNSLFENAPADAMGVRARWDQMGWADKPLWCIGGDGAMFDIGFQSLSRMFASGMPIKVFVLDTQVYSNTGGQASKSTPRAAVAKFATSGKGGGKKDLGLIAMSYGSVYVARVAMGSSDAQTLKAFLEAEAYDGPSIIIAYSHCIAHGIDMARGLEQQKLAVQSGYWPLYRYNPDMVLQGQNPLAIDSKEPSIALEQFVYNETRYRMLVQSDEARAEMLLKSAQNDVGSTSSL